MFTVSILVNGHPILTRSATNICPDDRDDATYKVDDGSQLKHRRRDGAVALAIKLLKTIKEP